MPMISIDQLVRSKRKTVALIITQEGKLVVRAPLRFPKARIDDLVNQKTDWIIRRQLEIQKTLQTRRLTGFVEGREFWYLGRRFQLKLVDQSRPALCLDGAFRLAKSSLPHAISIFQTWYRKQALVILNVRVADLSSKYGFQYLQVKITSAQTRWGSCSAKGTLSFPWRLIMAPLPVIDYVVIHELAHTVERNHQKNFWKIVNAIDPAYKDHLLWLKTNSINMKITD